MAQPMMHLLIADKIYTEKSGSIGSYGDFLLGSIAPDAVHAKENLKIFSRLSCSPALRYGVVSFCQGTI